MLRLRLRGWIGLPTFTRGQPDQQFIFINGRFVRDKMLNHAIRQGYSDVIYQGRNPVFAIFLDIDPKSVDVNVHPIKKRGSFQEFPRRSFISQVFCLEGDRRNKR